MKSNSYFNFNPECLNNEKKIKPPKIFVPLYYFVLFTIALLTLSFFVDIDVISTGKGVFAPTNEIKYLRFPISGVIEKVFFKKSDLIKKGDRLISFDMNREYEELKVLDKNIESARVNTIVLERINDVTLQSISDISSRYVNNKDSSLEEKVAYGKLRKLKNDLDNIDLDIDVYNSTIDELRVKASVCESHKNYIYSVPSRNRVLGRKGFISSVEMSDLENKYKKSIFDIEYENKKIASLLSSIHLKREQKQHIIDTHNLEVNSLIYNEKLRIDELIVKENAVQERIKYEVIYSEYEGYIDDAGKGLDRGFVEAGNEFAKIVPMNDSLVLDIMIPVKDSGFVAIGDNAIIKLDSCPYTRYGVVHGTVKYIFSDSTIIEGSAYYKAYIVSNSKSIDISGKTYALKPGLTASVDILNGKRTIIYYFIEPIIDNIKNSFKEH